MVEDHYLLFPIMGYQRRFGDEVAAQVRSYTVQG